MIKVEGNGMKGGGECRVRGQEKRVRVEQGEYFHFALTGKS